MLKKRSALFLLLIPFFFFLYLYLSFAKQKQRIDSAYEIKEISILQEDPYPLSNEELIQCLLKDQTNNLFAYDEEKGRNTVFSIEAIQSCTIDKKPPSTLVVSVSQKKPVALVFSSESVALDEKGNPFSLHQNYPKHTLTKLNCFEDQRERAALLLLFCKKCLGEECFVSFFDARGIDSLNLARRCCIVTLYDRVFVNHDTLTLPIQNIEKALENYLLMRQTQKEREKLRLIDLRSEQLLLTQEER